MLLPFYAIINIIISIIIIAITLDNENNAFWHIIKKDV